MVVSQNKLNKVTGTHSYSDSPAIEWKFEDMIEITLENPSDFNKIIDTLKRMGVPTKDRRLIQSCHILHKKGKYYIVHFKELFFLDNRPGVMTEYDRQRRNTIVHLLSSWNLCKVVNPSMIADRLPEDKMNIKIVTKAEVEDGEWELESKYTFASERIRQRSKEKRYA